MVDSPFYPTEERTEENIKMFIEICEFLLRIKSWKASAFSELFTIDRSLAEIFSAVGKAIINHDFESYVEVIIDLSSEVAVSPSKFEFTSLSKSYFEMKTNAQNRLKEFLNETASKQDLFLQFLIIFTITKLNNILNQTKGQRYGFEKKIENLITVINKYSPEEQKLLSSMLSYDTVFPSIFESGFFDDLGRYLFNEVMPFTQPVYNPQCILGVMVGLSLRNIGLIRENLITLIGKEIKTEYLYAIIGLITKSLAHENEIRSLWKKIDVDGNLAINLIELVMNSKEQDKYNAAYSVCNGFCSGPRRVSAMVGMFKGDLSNISIICDKLGLESDLMTALLACASQRLDLIQHNYKVISDKLKIDNIHAVQTILEITAGNINMVQELSEKRNQYFNIRDPHLLYWLMYLITQGKKMTRGNTRFQGIDSNFACQVVCERLAERFGFAIDNQKRTPFSYSSTFENAPEEEEKKDHVKEFKFIRSNNEEELNLDFLDIFKKLVNACWHEEDALRFLAEKMSKHASAHPRSLNLIWDEFQELSVLIIKNKLRKVYTDAENSIEFMESEIDKKYQSNKRMLDFLEKYWDKNPNQIVYEDVPTSGLLTQEQQSIISKLSNDFERAAYEVGCTVNIAGFQQFEQKYYKWHTCEKKAGEEVYICISWAKFCHGGHKTKVAQKGKRDLIICSWGTSTHPDCVINGQANPLSSASSRVMKNDKWSLVRKVRNKNLKDMKDLYQMASWARYRKSPDWEDFGEVNSSSQDSLSDILGSSNLLKGIEMEEDKIDNEQTSAAYHREDQKSMKDDENIDTNQTPKEDQDFLEKYEGGEEFDHNLETIEDEIIMDQYEDIDKDKFKKLIQNYTSQMFIVDLIKVLKFETKQIKKKCPHILAKSFMMLDDSLQRKVHIYEHIILLAHGFWRTGFLKLISSQHLLNAKSLKRIGKPYQIGFNPFYDAIMTFVSAYQDDMNNFSKHWIGLINALDLKTTGGYSSRHKALDVFMLIKGDDVFTGNGRHTNSYANYQNIFKRLFGKEFLKALWLHKLATMDENLIVELFDSSNMAATSYKMVRLSHLYSMLIDQFMFKYLEMDDDSVEWLQGLTKVSMGDSDGFRYICKEYSISNSKASIYKAIWTYDHFLMEPLFRAVNELVPFEVARKVSSIINGNIEELRNLIINKIQIKTQSTNLRLDYRNVHRINAPKDIQDRKEDLLEYLRDIYNLIEGESFSLDTLKQIFTKTGIDGGIASILFGFSALLNNDFMAVDEIFEYPRFKDNLDNAELVDATIRIISGRWNDACLKILVENIIKRKNLYPCSEPQVIVRQLNERIEFKVLKSILQASEGSMLSCARVIDLIEFQNKSSIWTLLTVLASGGFSKVPITSEPDLNIIQQRFQKDIKRLIEKLFSLATCKPELMEFVRKYKVDYLLFALMCNNFSLIKKIFNITELFDFLDEDILSILIMLARKDESVPDLEAIFDKAAPYIWSIFDSFGMLKNEAGEYMIKIDNLPKVGNPLTQKIHEVYKSIQIDISSLDLENNDYDWNNEIYQKEYAYVIENTGVSLNATDLFEIMFRAGHEDLTSNALLIELLVPLFREIPGAVRILKICLAVVKGGTRENLLDQIYSLVKLSITSMVSEKLKAIHEKASYEEFENWNVRDFIERIDTFRITPAMLLMIRNLLKTSLLLLNKNPLALNLEDIKSTIYQFWDSMYTYQSEINWDMKAIDNAEQLTDFIIFIYGIWKGEFNLAQFIGQEIGCFEPQKVRDIFNILKRNRDLIFGKGIFNLPSGVQSLYKVPNAGDLVEGMLDPFVAEKSLRGMRHINEMKDHVHNTAGYFKDISFNTPIEAIFGAMFKQFDKDNSGYIDYHQFWELSKFLGLKLDKEKLLELFAQADENWNNQINPHEFKQAMLIIKKQICFETLKSLHLTIEDLILFGIMALLFLLQLFVLIFLGIEAFSQTTDTSSIVNSLLPLAAGFLAGSRKIDIQEQIEKVKTYIASILSKIRSSQ